MLEKVDLKKKIEKEEYKKIIDPLEIKIGELQRQAKDLKIPIIIVFEGWDGAGKGTLINRLILPLDPRGFNVYSTHTPNEEELLRPFLWRFWTKTPAKGRLAIFDKSWYRYVLEERVDGNVQKKDWMQAYEEIKAFERQLADSGCIIIKFFLHISKKEQKKRLDEIEKNKATSWRVTKSDWKHHKQYQKYLEAFQEMIEETDTNYAPWTIIESHDRRFAEVKIFKNVCEAIEDKINEISNTKKPVAKTKSTTSDLKVLNSSILDKIDVTQAISKKEYEEKIDKYQEKIRDIEYLMHIKRVPLIIVYEGCDAAGKGGNIKRLTQKMDPRGYEVVPIAAPNDEEKVHHYLWRFWDNFPKAGHITIFDRSWYGRVLVERVESFCSEADWKRAYKEINDMEEHLVSFGTVIVKFWLQIDQQEQLKRFEERQKTPDKQWKITEEDWRNREKWDRYKEAIDEMLFRTSTTYAPWTIIESNCKYFARLKTLKTVIDVMEKKLKKYKRVIS